MDLLSAFLLALLFKNVAGLLKRRFNWSAGGMIGLISAPAIWLLIYYVVHPSLSMWLSVHAAAPS